MVGVGVNVSDGTLKFTAVSLTELITANGGDNAANPVPTILVKLFLVTV